MSDRISLSWSLMNPYGIAIDAANEIWHSGCVRALLPIGDMGVLVATDTGGLWYADSTGVGYPLADLDSPDLICLAKAKAPGGNFIYFAGGENLWASEPTSSIPKNIWSPILPTETVSGVSLGKINAIVVAGDTNRIVIATSKGIFWSQIPAPGSPTGYAWYQAVDSSGKSIQGNFYSICLTRTRPGLVQSFVASYTDWKSSPNGKLYYGKWEASGFQLVMNFAAILSAPSFSMRFAETSLASSEGDPYVAYAAAGDLTKGSFAALYKSTDGGQSWTVYMPAFIDKSGNKASDKYVLGYQGSAGLRCNNCIAVSPHTSTIVALGWQLGVVVSTDSGGSFTEIPWSQHLHRDIHAMVFQESELDKTGRTMFVGSDGGVVRMDNLGRDQATHISLYNKHLATLQFESRPGRMFRGGIGVAEKGGIVAGGTQDNGVVCTKDLMNEPWRVLIGGDGHDAVGISTPRGKGVIYTNNHIPNPVPFLAWWDQTGTIVRVGDSIDFDLGPWRAANLTQATAMYNARITAIRKPAMVNSANGLVYSALAIDRTMILGFTCEDDGTSPRWRTLFPHPEVDPNRSADEQPYVNVVDSYDGDVLYCGFMGGAICTLSQNRPAWDAMRILSVPPNLLNRNDGEPLPRIEHMAVAHNSLAFASLIKANSSHELLRLRDERYVDVLNLGPDKILGLEVLNDGRNIAVFVARDDKVLLSEDLGDNWTNASTGLPRRPHCTGLRLGRYGPADDILYLSTWGRSVWRAKVRRI